MDVQIDGRMCGYPDTQINFMHRIIDTRGTSRTIGAGSSRTAQRILTSRPRAVAIARAVDTISRRDCPASSAAPETRCPSLSHLTRSCAGPRCCAQVERDARPSRPEIGQAMSVASARVAEYKKYAEGVIGQAGDRRARLEFRLLSSDSTDAVSLTSNLCSRREGPAHLSLIPNPLCFFGWDRHHAEMEAKRELAFFERTVYMANIHVQPTKRAS